MRAAYIAELGPADAIRVGELPTPVPGPTDVLVRVELVVVDPVDTLVRSGAYRTPTPFPFVVGRDLVGTVAGAGAGAAGFAPGDRFWCNSLGHDGRQGSFAEYAVVPVERLNHLPDGADPVASVAVLHPAATAHLALFRHGGLRPGRPSTSGERPATSAAPPPAWPAWAGPGCWPAPAPRTPRGAGPPAPPRCWTTATPAWPTGCAGSPPPGSTCTSTPPATWTCPPRSTCWPCGAASSCSPAPASA